MAFLVWIFALWQQKKTKCELYNGVFKEKTCKSHHILKFLFHMSFLDIEFLVVTRTQHESKNKLYIYIYIYIYIERERERENQPLSKCGSFFRWMIKSPPTSKNWKKNLDNDIF